MQDHSVQFVCLLPILPTISQEIQYSTRSVIPSEGAPVLRARLTDMTRAAAATLCVWGSRSILLYCSLPDSLRQGPRKEFDIMLTSLGLPCQSISRSPLQPSFFRDLL